MLSWKGWIYRHEVNTDMVFWCFLCVYWDSTFGILSCYCSVRFYSTSCFILIQILRFFFLFGFASCSCFTSWFSCRLPHTCLIFIARNVTFKSSYRLTATSLWYFLWKVTGKFLVVFSYYARGINLSVRSRGGLEPNPSGHRARGGVHPGQVAGPSQGHTETNETNNHAHVHTPADNLETPINLTCMFLDSGRKPELMIKFTNKKQIKNVEFSAYSLTRSRDLINDLKERW